MTSEEKRAKQAEAMRRYRAKLKAEGKPTRPPTTESERAWQREYVRRKRIEAAASGEVLASDTWHSRNPDKHRDRVRRYRESNAGRMREVGRRAQAERRSTPWGRITNNLVVVLHSGVRRNSRRPGKYADAIGYTWSDLRAHLEAQFTPVMNWENWGMVWELDHIRPLSSFQYTSLDDPLFRECWALINLRPLLREENASKGAKPA